jgi:hypothetical protein
LKNLVIGDRMLCCTWKRLDRSHSNGLECRMSSSELCNLTVLHIPWSTCRISTASQCNASFGSVSWCLPSRLEHALGRDEGTTSQDRCKRACSFQGWAFSEASMEPGPPLIKFRDHDSEICFKQITTNSLHAGAWAWGGSRINYLVTTPVHLQVLIALEALVAYFTNVSVRFHQRLWR